MDEIPDERWAMEQALREARATARMGNVPVGAVALHEGRVVGRAANLRDTLQDPTAHAEILALRDAARSLGSWRLAEVTLVVTLEPCAMCAGALAQARVGRLVYGATEPKTGAVESIARMLEGTSTGVRTGLLAEDCAAEVQRFFEALRDRR
ncbi:MAG: nucleoside deaminase [Myxococcota bacterium]